MESDGRDFWADELYIGARDSEQVQGELTGRLHIAFQAQDRAMVDAFYQAALAHGGRDNGAPGERAPTTLATTRRLCWIRMATTSKPCSTVRPIGVRLRCESGLDRCVVRRDERRLWHRIRRPGTFTRNR